VDSLYAKVRLRLSSHSLHSRKLTFRSAVGEDCIGPRSYLYNSSGVRNDYLAHASHGVILELDRMRLVFRRVAAGCRADAATRSCVSCTLGSSSFGEVGRRRPLSQRLRGRQRCLLMKRGLREEQLVEMRLGKGHRHRVRGSLGGFEVGAVHGRYGG
jgi:hypothetical protein